MLKLLVLVSMLLLAKVPLAPAQEIELQPFRPQGEIGQSPDAAKTFSAFSRAWTRGDAGRVADMIPGNGRASVLIESRGVSSQMSSGQVEALLAGIFSDVERAAFELSTIQFSDESSAYAVGDWVYQPRGGDRQREQVFVVFRDAGGDSWALSELRLRPAR